MNPWKLMICESYINTTIIVYNFKITYENKLRYIEFGFRNQF